MLIIDQLKRSDPRLRLLGALILAGMFVLLGGLWYLQIVASKRYVENLRNQSFRTVRLPAIRGRILDRHGVALAENRPSYNINLYLDELRASFQQEYRVLKGDRRLTRAEMTDLGRLARFRVVSNSVQRLSTVLQQPLGMDEEAFHRHYDQRLALPLTVVPNLTLPQAARFQEMPAALPGFDLEAQATRVYPHRATAAHVLGYLRRDDSSAADEEAFFNYRLPDFKGVVGVEGRFDAELRGRAGVKSVLVNNLGYRQNEFFWSAAEPGRNVVLTLDLRLQQASEAALLRAMPEVRGAVIVMDGANGDLLALASAPAFDPNLFVGRLSPEDWQRLTDPVQRPLVSRATREIYAPGSIFKLIIALAALEAGLDPDESFTVEANPARPWQGQIYVGRRAITDLAAPGEYDLQRAIVRSSNAYFVHHGLGAGLDAILRLAQRLHLGELTGVPIYQESAGILPTREWVRRRRGGMWFDGDTANLCMGQGEVAVTPLQMAVMTAAIANGGRVFWPRLVERLEPQDASTGQATELVPAGRLRNQLGVNPRHLEILREAMFADVEDPEGTGRAAAVEGMRIGGKTGTAQITKGNKVVDHTTWFVSFCQHAERLFVVVVMVESGASGGLTCAPVARQVYQTIQKLYRPATLAGGSAMANGPE